MLRTTRRLIPACTPLSSMASAGAAVEQPLSVPLSPGRERQGRSRCERLMRGRVVRFIHAHVPESAAR